MSKKYKAASIFLNDYLASRGISKYPYSFARDEGSAFNLSGYITPLQFERMTMDIGYWRECMIEMESAYFPMRAKSQRMFMDVHEDGFIKSVVQRWEELVLQRDYEIYQIKKGKKVVSEVLSETISEQNWFKSYLKYVLEAELFGYSLIELGDIVNDSFPYISFTRRWVLRPDGIDGSGKNPILTNIPYAVDGVGIKNDPLIEMCNHWISTPSNIGVSKCGYGLYYNIALYYIHLKHILEWNIDYIENYGQPIKKGSTNKTGKDRKKFENFLRNGASSQWILLDKAMGDDISYEMVENAGTAWKCYGDVEQRLKAVICQILLGHEDAMQSSPDKLGGNQKSNKEGENINLIQQALNAKQILHGDFVCGKINEISAPLFRKLGRYVGSKTIKNLIPDGYHFGLKNDVQENEMRNRKINHFLNISSAVKNMNDAGWDADEKEISDFIGLKFTPMTPERKVIMEQTRKTESIIRKEDGAELSDISE